MIPNLYPLDDICRLVRDRPDRWRPLVFTNGCFDLIHVGHVRYLQAARALGRSLLVGLNSDRSVSALKPNRPIVPERQRAEVLVALKPVDGAILFETPTAIPLIEALQPDIYVKGGDWTPDTLPEAPAVRAYGGEIAIVAIEMPTSTTGIIRRILATQSPLVANH